MILRVNQILEGAPVECETAYNPKTLDLDYVDWHYLDKIDLQGRAERVFHTVRFHGRLEGNVEQICARCLERIERTFSIPFDLVYEIQQRDVIDTTGDLRDILLLEHPDQFLCQPNCRGICQQCGAGLNTMTCSCSDGSKKVKVESQTKGQ
jgi:uncharacterized metal-binding protein YceD (DUF177 family)